MAPSQPGKRRHIDIDTYTASPTPPLQGQHNRERHTVYSAVTSSRTLLSSNVYLSRPTSPGVGYCNEGADVRDTAHRMDIDDAGSGMPDFLGIGEDDEGDEEPIPEHLTNVSEHNLADVAIQKPKAKKTMDNPLAIWTAEIDTYVDELLRHDGRGDVKQDGCVLCQITCISTYRCCDCQDTRILCAGCMVVSHRALPYHRMRVWAQDHFQKTSLKALGLRIQLGHQLGEQCRNPTRSINDDFTVIDVNGIHSVSVDYCNCEVALSRHIQLLRSRLFPSTTVDPKTAATFNVLETFQLLTFTSKVSGFEFYKGLARLTDNTGINPPPDRYHAFLRMVREWRHVRLLKRSGRGHAQTGVRGTKQGECAVLCPACPLPGINLPSDWKNTPEGRQWIYSLFVGIDANFRLKRLNVSNNQRDPGLNHGYAYVVEDTAFKEYLLKFDEKIPDDISTCNNHNALKAASMRGGKGTSVSGVGTIECSRHDMKRPLSVGDLQKGERYVNMDYFFLSSISQNAPIRLVVSYDIACQWSRNLAGRCQIYPPNALSQGHSHYVIYLVPKFHLPAHIAICQIDYSFNLVPRVGRTDGEAPERGWAATNAVASSTKEMGPGSRRDTLDDHFGDYNWRKVSALAATFLRKVKQAVASRAEHVTAFLEFSAALPEVNISDWTLLCHEWEQDRSKRNPFRVVGHTISDDEVRLQFALEDNKELEAAKELATRSGRPVVNKALHDTVSAGMLIAQGLEIEEQQRRLHRDTLALGIHSTDLQRAKILERSNGLRRKIDGWIEIQHLYVPAVATLRTRADSNGGGANTTAYNLELLLPSQTLGQVIVDSKFLSYEWRLRSAHAYAALQEIRTLLLLRSHMYQWKDRWARGQVQITRSTTLVAQVFGKIQAAASRYRDHRIALSALAVPLGIIGWEIPLKELLPEDLVGLSSLDDDGSEGRKKLSWIWKVHGTGAGDEDENAITQEALRVEWCRSRARAHRWQEECILLNEEMRRVRAFFQYQADWWTGLATTVRPRRATTLNHPIASNILIPSQENDSVMEGKRAYARRQARLRLLLRDHCGGIWEGLDTLLLTGIGAPVGEDCFVECP